ncbi:CLUMA_CG017296, isoform A [Clunio marinus]|nr:CLUMA_CG017296, isoform A [Clunio marinus]
MQQPQMCRPGSATKEMISTQCATMHWFAMVGEKEASMIDDLIDLDHSLTQKEREERIKQLKERQNEERQRKLEELKAQALATQKLREQKEEERRKRMEDMKLRDNEKRTLVEERKKAIWEAEKERREYILRKNLEREQRLDSKRKNERSQIAFAFGSSTPRMLDSESGSIWAHRRANSIQNVAYNTSISPITRRSCERDLPDGSKKRATSASGLDRQSEAQKLMSTSMHEVFHWGPNTSAAPKKLSLSVAGSQIDFEGPPSPRRQTQSASARNAARNRLSMVMVDNVKDDSCDMTRSYNVHRRKTDLMPTIPSPRDMCRSSLGTYTPRTPGRAFSMTRLDQLAKPKRRNGEHISAIIERERRQALELEALSKASLQQNQSKRKSRSMSQLGGRNSGTRSRDGSQASSDRFKTPSPLQKHHKNGDATRSMTQLSNGIDKKISPVKAGLRSGEITPKSLSTSRPGSAMSTSTTNSAQVTKRSTPIRKTRPVSIAVTGVSRDEKPPVAPLSVPKPITKRTSSSGVSKTPTGTETPKNRVNSAKATPKSSNTPSVLSPSVENPPKIIQQSTPVAKEIPAVDETCKSEKTIINNVIKAEQAHTAESFSGVNLVDVTTEAVVEVTETIVTSVPDAPIEQVQKKEKEKPVELSPENPLENADMTASMIAKSRITTEEEAKAKIAERRRLAREEAERQAELERQRLEEEAAAERQRQADEEERQRLLEAETIRLAEEQRRVEEERLQQAIEENKKREEEEQKRREEEARQKAERELAEKKAREDAEKAKAENAERLKKEEKDREERRKRVEAIMARTRKGGSANTPSKNESDAVDLSKSQIDSMSQSMIEQTLNSEQSNFVNNQDDQSPSSDKQESYEQSVTEKENLLMGGFNKMNLNGNGNGINNNLLETNNNLNLLNGQQNGKNETPTSDLIINDGATNGHEKNSIESAFIPSNAPEIPTKANEDKLIDFGSSDPTIENPSTNLNNNNFIDSNSSSLITHNNLNNNNLVAASESNNDERDLSLL